MDKKKPFLKWAGGKYRYLDHILGSFPQAKRLIEPFTGSGAIFINTDYTEYLLADENQDLVNLYHHLRQEGTIFIDYCAHYFTGKYNNTEDFYQLREKFNQSQSTHLRSALFVYLNRHGYNGLCRYNQSGQFNVPFGRYTKPYFPFKEMLNFHQRSQSVQFLKADFRETFALAQPGDIIYCDPPYIALTSSAKFSAYTPLLFTETDQIALAELAENTAQKGITVIISNHDTEFTRYHYRTAKITSFPVQRFISCHATERKEVQELVAVFSLPNR